MKRRVWLKLAFCWIMAATFVRAEGTAEVFLTDVKFDAALKRAAEQKKVVVIDFFTTWCGPCKLLDKTTWKDEKVVALLKEKAVPLKIDAEKEVALAEKFKIEGYPTMIILKPDGSVLAKLLGYRDAKEFINDFNNALAGKSS